MNNIRKLTDSLFWVGVNDRRIALFENVYPVPTGMSYNSYVLLDEKTALFDTVDASFTHDFSRKCDCCLKRPHSGLSDRKPHGAGSLRVHRRCDRRLPGGKDCMHRKGCGGE